MSSHSGKWSRVFAISLVQSIEIKWHGDAIRLMLSGREPLRKAYSTQQNLYREKL